MMKLINSLLLVILVIWFVLLGMFNSQPVEFNYAFGICELPLVAVMLLSFVFGALLAMLVFGLQSVYWRVRARSLKRKIEREHLMAKHAEIEKDFIQGRSG